MPKQTQLQNSTLTIQIPVSTVLGPRSSQTAPGSPVSEALPAHAPPSGDGNDGAGMMSGLMPRRSRLPASPTAAERRRPGFVPSTRYQRKGFARVRAVETWRVETHGSLR